MICHFKRIIKNSYKYWSTKIIDHFCGGDIGSANINPNYWHKWTKRKKSSYHSDSHKISPLSLVKELTSTLLCCILLTVWTMFQKYNTILKSPLDVLSEWFMLSTEVTHPWAHNPGAPCGECSVSCTPADRSAHTEPR